MLRLILALLLAIGSFPMPAMAHDGVAPMAMSGHAMGGMEHKAPAAPMQHECIGCIAVADWNGGRIAAIAPVAPPPLTDRVAALPLLPGEAPTPPPPRIA